MEESKIQFDAKVFNPGRITIPQATRERFKINAGDNFEVHLIKIE